MQELENDKLVADSDLERALGKMRFLESQKTVAKPADSPDKKGVSGIVFGTYQ